MNLIPRLGASPRQLLLGTLLGLALASGAQAANGFVVNRDQEAQIKVGMSRQQVMQLLGRPAHNLKYRNEPGRTWTYGVLGATSNSTSDQLVFDVDFAADGTVAEKAERTELMN